MQTEFIKKEMSVHLILNSHFRKGATFLFHRLSFAMSKHTCHIKKGLKGNQNRDHMGWIFT